MARRRGSLREIRGRFSLTRRRSSVEVADDELGGGTSEGGTSGTATASSFAVDVSGRSGDDASGSAARDGRAPASSAFWAPVRTRSRRREPTTRDRDPAADRGRSSEGGKLPRSQSSPAIDRLSRAPPKAPPQAKPPSLEWTPALVRPRRREPAPWNGNVEALAPSKRSPSKDRSQGKEGKGRNKGRQNRSQSLPAIERHSQASPPASPQAQSQAQAQPRYHRRSSQPERLPRSLSRDDRRRCEPAPWTPRGVDPDPDLRARPKGGGRELTRSATQPATERLPRASQPSGYRRRSSQPDRPPAASSSAARDENVACCPRHPFVQLRRRAKRTGEWRTLLESCTLCTAIDDNSSFSSKSKSTQKSWRQPRKDAQSSREGDDDDDGVEGLGAPMGPSVLDEKELGPCENDGDHVVPKDEGSRPSACPSPSTLGPEDDASTLNSSEPPSRRDLNPRDKSRARSPSPEPEVEIWIYCTDDQEKEPNDGGDSLLTFDEDWSIASGAAVHDSTDDSTDGGVSAGEDVKAREPRNRPPEPAPSNGGAGARAGRGGPVWSKKGSTGSEATAKVGNLAARRENARRPSWSPRGSEDSETAEDYEMDYYVDYAIDEGDEGPEDGCFGDRAERARIFGRPGDFMGGPDLTHRATELQAGYVGIGTPRAMFSGAKVGLEDSERAVASEDGRYRTKGSPGSSSASKGGLEDSVRTAKMANLVPLVDEDDYNPAI